jgi:hypothetical protein
MMMLKTTPRHNVIFNKNNFLKGHAFTDAILHFNSKKKENENLSTGKLQKVMSPKICSYKRKLQLKDIELSEQLSLAFNDKRKEMNVFTTNNHYYIIRNIY